MLSPAETLFELSAAIDRAAASADYRSTGRVQIREFLTEGSARTLRRELEALPWGLAWRAGKDGPHGHRAAEVRPWSEAERRSVGDRVSAAMRAGDYAFLYAYYPLVDAYLQSWDESEAAARLLEHLNDAPFLDLAREITGITELLKADAQASLFGPSHFLAQHDDLEVGEGARVAYVMTFADSDWRPDWGGYLAFYDDQGDLVGGFRPRFNALNLFAVPQRHNVTFVPPFAPPARFAVSGWLRDR